MVPKSLLKSLFLWNALATIILLPRFVNAQTCEVYVSPSGSDSSAGTLSAPWRTVQHAFDYAQPGDTVCFRGGTYAMTTTTGYNQALYRSGTPTSRITFMNYPGEVAIIAGSTKVQADYVTFQGAPVAKPGLIFDGPGARNMDLVDIMYSHDVTFDHVEIRHGAYHAGLYQYGGYNNKVIGSYIHDNGRPGFINTDQGIYWDATTGGGNLIANNVVEHNISSGVQLYPSPSQVTVEQNTIVNNGNYGMELFGTGNAIVNNIFSNNGNSARNPQMNIDPPAKSLVIDSNIYWHTTTSQQGYSDPCSCHASTHSLVKDPAFVDVSSHNYHLKLGSPAIGTGNPTYALRVDKSGHTRPSPPDLGAYEFGVAAPTLQISITPTALSFGNQSVGSTSAAKTVTLQNTGTANLTISAITSSSPAFLLASATTLPAVLTPGQTALVSVSFRPATVGSQAGSLKVTSTAPSPPTTVSLSGNGVQQVLGAVR